VVTSQGGKGEGERRGARKKTIFVRKRSIPYTIGTKSRIGKHGGRPAAILREERGGGTRGKTYLFIRREEIIEVRSSG